MSKKKLRNADKRLAKEMQEAKKRHDDAMRIRVNRMGSTMHHIDAYIGMSDYNAQLMREGRGRFSCDL
jgi:hypothetical protein